MFIPLLGQQHTSSPKNPQKALPHAMAPAFVLQQDIIFPHLIHDMVDLYSYNHGVMQSVKHKILNIEWYPHVKLLLGRDFAGNAHLRRLPRCMMFEGLAVGYQDICVLYIYVLDTYILYIYM